MAIKTGEGANDYFTLVEMQKYLNECCYWLWLWRKLDM